MQNITSLYQAKQVYQLDKLAMQLDAQSSKQLMGKAALAVWKSIQIHWPSLTKAVIFAGAGNNGGDAFALASLMKNAKMSVELIAVGDLTQQSDESRAFRESWEAQGGLTQTWHGSCPDCELIIDGLLGIGLNRILDQGWCSMIAAINSKSAIRVSIDIPSGLNADTGIAMPVAFRADLTVTFIARKIGAYLADGPDFCGERVFDNLGLSSASAEMVPADYELLNPFTIELPSKRKNNCYKNQFGHVFVIGGGLSMSGAVRLAAMAALRSGAGLVSLCVHPDNVMAASCQHAELMVTDWNAINDVINQATVIIVGPGLGNSSQARQLLEKLSEFTKPMVIDADALEAGFINTVASSNCVITPHPGEAARLLKSTSHEIQLDRVACQQKLTDKWPVVSVLKGAGTLVAYRDELMTLCDHGHGGMATAGMGDVLAGIIGGYLAQGLAPLKAAQTGVLIHALAAEYYARKQDAASLIASDVMAEISSVVFDCRNR